MSNTDKVVKFLQEAKVFYIATIDGNQPRVRPFGIALNIDGKLSLCTGSYKNVYKQIEKNPNTELSAVTADGKWIRVSGLLVNVTNEANQQKFFAAAPMLNEIYSGDKRKDFTILSFKTGAATIEDMEGHKETIELNAKS
ncbi:pyridoxamine 5'-phosphate oxidase family protein [Endomicrobium proavitum]|uniref:Pyridoxamine 5-phosphate oxidase-related FMN-binding protein n=1 Tax=Endomicrobium proavitum TaxID=1408281 RepID=A0A0G3WKX3_9BACT|nr:pyridoxamine 5'-phosphate oxidase family protein [Endomicrobium proavitum]AKL98502.1 Pyridoxamine 5-phosphate oxidase-related FMN-binding protein [Endomicrobium proavitum]